MIVIRRSATFTIAAILLSSLLLTGCPNLFATSRPPVASFVVVPSSGAIVGDMVILNGSNSRDPQGKTLSFQWSLAGPSESTALLYPDYGPLVSFQADKPGQYAVVLTVTAGDKSATATETFTIAGEASGITAFGFLSQPAIGVIDQVGKTIAVTLPSGTDVSALVATFSVIGSAVTVNGTPQLSGVTQNDFTNIVPYLVTASDSSTQCYTVSVTLSSSVEPLVGKWRLSTANTVPASSIPMAMNLTITSDLNWIAIGSQPGSALVTYGSWSSLGTGSYLMTFAFGGPEGVANMALSLSGGTLIGTFSDADGPETYVFVPGTEVLPDPILGSWHLSSIDPAPASSQSMNFTFNADKTWTMSGVEAVSAISADGGWIQDSQGHYTITFISGGPGVSSMAFTLSGGALTGSFLDGQVLRTMVLRYGELALPASINPLPELFRTINGDFVQDFKDRAWRLGPAAPGDPWSDYNYMRFAISSDGRRYTEYLAGTAGNSGYLNWYMLGTEQKLDFLDSANQALFSFTVIDYSAGHLHLRMLWGTEVREWIFSAGAANLCGLVLDTAYQIFVDHYLYLSPAAGASVQVGTMDEYAGFSALPILPAITDEKGLFEFPNLAAYAGQVLYVKVSRSGYADSSWLGDPRLSILNAAPVFMMINL